jgi:hypothetical protein
MKSPKFDRQEHVYRNDALVELIKDAVRFFNGTPVHEIPLPERFTGTGVYALYYTSKNRIYARYGELNRLSYNYPIYVGKAVPKGWRQSRTSDRLGATASELHNRIKEHCRNIAVGNDLKVSDFTCRFVIFEDTGSDMIGTIEAALIKLNRPLWNTVVDGFGNHTPGVSRFEQAKSQWDVLHPGRAWAERCKGTPPNKDLIVKQIAAHLAALGAQK